MSAQHATRYFCEQLYAWTSCLSFKLHVLVTISATLQLVTLVVCMLADSNSEITMQPQPTEKEIQFILEAIAEYLTVKVCFPATHAALQCLNLIPTCSCYVLCPG